MQVTAGSTALYSTESRDFLCPTNLQFEGIVYVELSYYNPTSVHLEVYTEKKVHACLFISSFIYQVRVSQEVYTNQ